MVDRAEKRKRKRIPLLGKPPITNVKLHEKGEETTLCVLKETQACLGRRRGDNKNPAEKEKNSTAHHQEKKNRLIFFPSAEESESVGKGRRSERRDTPYNFRGRKREKESAFGKPH